MRRMGLIKRGLTLVLCGMLMALAAGMAWAPVNVLYAVCAGDRRFAAADNCKGRYTKSK